MKPKFVLNEHELQFTVGLRYPLMRSLEKVQAVDRTAAGTLEVESLGVSINTRELTFSKLPVSDYAALHNWFDNIANGAANGFTYYDEEGQTMQIRITTGKLNWPQDSSGRYSGTLMVEVVG